MRLQDVFAYLFDVGKDILATTQDLSTGVLSAQTGDSTTQTPDADHAEWWQHAGFASRPATPSQGNASCQGLVLKRSDQDIIFATRDTRGTAILGNLSDGETCVYASASQARTVWKADGSVSHITTDDNTVKGNSVFIRVDPKTIRFYSTNVGQWGDATGWHMRTWHGAKFDMTGIGLPAPFSALGLNSTIMLTADVITLDAAVLNLGRTGATGLPGAVVQAAPLAAIMAQVATALTDVSNCLSGISTYVSSFTGTGTFPGILIFGGLVTTATGALGTAVTALAAVALPAGAGGPGTATNTTVG